MKITYDQAVDTLRIILNDADINESDEPEPRIILDYDDHGNLVGLEILNIRQRLCDGMGAG